MWTPWGHGKMPCIERCPHFRGIWDMAKCPQYRGVLISVVSFKRGFTVAPTCPKSKQRFLGFEANVSLLTWSPAVTSLRGREKHWTLGSVVLCMDTIAHSFARGRLAWGRWRGSEMVSAGGVIYMCKITLPLLLPLPPPPPLFCFSKQSRIRCKI